MRASKVAGLLLIFACGPVDENTELTPEERLLGTWFVGSPDQYKCYVGLTFEEHNKYEQDLVCVLNSGAAAMQITLGEWFIAGTDGDRVRLSPKQSSCPTGPYPVLQYAYGFSGEQLRLVSKSELVLMGRVDGPPTGNAEVRFGCFDAERVFTPSPVEPL